ncbi:uncharacterized protein LOC128220184 [Mya arenaria]|uniref:uncharacterized protein LOC128220184 n=1 Tax=Mya arenaria TaxID=6604 RepID=UPI0022E16218|nr:uncharacterized protein LOC128220184 [Mya arenaria]
MDTYKATFQTVLVPFYLSVTLVLMFSNVIGKPQEKQIGPCEGMDCMHGILMHGDDKQGDQHTAEDQYLRFKSQLETGKADIGPDSPENTFHGALMHGDMEAGKHHDENENKQILPEDGHKAGVQDLHDVIHNGMHGEEPVDKHEWSDKETIKEQTENGPEKLEKLMHGILMHGASDFKHSEEETDETEIQTGDDTIVMPVNGEKIMHGLLMHGDINAQHDHEHDNSEESSDSLDVGPDTKALHGILMHGDANIGEDHSEEDSNTVHDVFRDISLIPQLGLDEDLLRIIGLEKLLEKDREEYAEWILNNPQFQDESMMGSTYLTVSDTMLNDMELMKKRYLEKTNTNIDEVDSFKDIPFTSDDANAVLSEGQDRSADGEDARHDLELLGSTEPLNARHKVKMELLRGRESLNSDED